VASWLPHPPSLLSLAGFTIWLSALSTLAIFSFLYRENRAFRMAEHILLGLGVGFTVAATITGILLPKWWDPLSTGMRTGRWGDVSFGVLALALGLMWYGVYHKRTIWLSRIVMGLTVGAGAGIAFKAEISDKLPQIVASFKSPYVRSAESTAYNNSLSNTIFLIVLFSVLSYFFFSIEHKGRTLEKSSRLGRSFLMITFGIFFGNTIMTRLAVFIERIWFLLSDWLRIGS